MGSAWVSALAMLLALVNGARNEDDSFPCAEVRASSSVVTLGSSVTATCVIRDNCPLIAGQAVHIAWHLGQHLLPSSSPAANDSSSRTSTVLIPSFNATREYLTCCVQASPCQIVGGVEIRAGYPPPVPQNLSCQTNLTNPNTLTCRWDPGQTETHLWTKYTLHTEIWNLEKNHTYELPMGVHHHAIPRSDFVFFSEMEIRVRAENALGEASSIPLVLEPLRSAKFDPPKILKVQAEPNRYGCLKFSWGLLRHLVWVPAAGLKLEVRLKSAESSQWSEPTPIPRVIRIRPVEVCRLLHGTEYNAQLRVRYQQSPWSEWSRSHSGVTLEKAPTGRLDYWMRVSRELRQKHLSVHLFWKPSKQFRANGKNVSYVVSLQRPLGEKGQVCSTSECHCAFLLPRGLKKVFLRAVNAVGKSSPTEVPVLKHRDRTSLSDVKVLPCDDDRSLFVQWTSLASSAGITGYVVEWRPLLNTNPSHILFDLADRNQSSLVITGSFEPYKPYEVSVHPRYKDGIGLPQTVDAYSRQKAPSMVPKIKVKETWQSHMELTWDEIPMGQRNGIIQRYRVFYWDKEEDLKFVDADLEKRRVILRDLHYLSLYKAFIMVSTEGGSLNGSTVHLKTEPMDAVSVVMIVIPCGVGLALLVIIFVMTCEQRLKVCFWPTIPDPANSNIKKWTSETMQDIPPAWDIQEPNPVYISHLSFLDLSKKLDKGGDEAWLRSGSEDTSDLGESICGSPLTPGYSGTTSESVPYATVIFSGPYASQPANQPHVYLRSESTQPLLEAEEPFSPKSYQNMSVDGIPSEQYFFGQCQDGSPERGEVGTLWDDFPMLRALAMNDAQSEL